MASFSVPCPKTSALFSASQPKTNSHQQQRRHHSISFRPDSISNPPLLVGSPHDNCNLPIFQGSNRNLSDVFKVCVQLKEIPIEKSSNSTLVSETRSEESSKRPNTVPDASTISAFMTQVADLVELVNSTDIMELQLKQLDSEILIRKKEALPQPPVASPVVMMQPPSPQAMVPPQLPSAQIAAPASAAPLSPLPASATVTTIPTKPKSSHSPLKCPMAGTFYRSPAPGTPPFVKVGDKIQKGQVVCIIEAMKLMNEIEADQSGTLVEILADDGKPVSVDTPLFVIEP